MSKKNKKSRLKSHYYVAAGTGVPTVFNNHDEVSKYVRGISGAYIKKFASKDKAHRWVSQNQSHKTHQKQKPKISLQAIAKPMAYAFVDGSFNKTTKTYGYGIVFFDGKCEATLQGSETGGVYADSCHTAGELLGALRAIEFAIRKKIELITIYYDFDGIEGLATGKQTPNSELTSYYVEQINAYAKHITILFSHTKSHSGIRLNEKADKLACYAVNN